MAFPDSLSQHVLRGVEEVGGKKIGEDQCGSYGFVYKVKVDGIVRIAKKPHREFLTNVSNAEKDRVLANFKRECSLLSELRHPNIVQFIGVYRGKSSKNDIALVMEKLECDLAQFVSTKPDIQLHMKLSILRDVTYGLVYLHEYNPPIIHRDLTAQNILLTKSYQAKIADVGVSKVMDETARKARSHTLAPGQIYYMPPEVCTANPLCTSKLDIFSFGQLCLHTLLGDYPKVLEVEVTAAMLREGTIEKMRRLVSLDLIGSNHCLYPLITQCLMDNPDKRPTTREVNTSLCSLAETHSKDVKVKEVEIAQLLSKNEDLSEKLLEQDQQLKKLQDKATALKQINENLIANISELRSDMESMKIQHADGNRNLPAQHAEIEQYDRIFMQIELKSDDTRSTSLSSDDTQSTLKVEADMTTEEYSDMHVDIPVEEEEWYYKNIDRKMAELKCRTSGDYIVRYSEQMKSYVLTCNWNGQRKHIMIHKNQNVNGTARYSFESSSFPTIRALLEYHCETGTIITLASQAIISRPVTKQLYPMIK